MTVYVLVVGILGAAGIHPGQAPSPALWAAMVAAYAAALVFPVLLDPTTGRRSSISSCASVVMGFVLPTGWAILATAAGALLAGFHIRRYRSTPGGMLFGSSWVTCSVAAGFIAMHAVPDSSTTGSLLAVGAFGLACHLASGLLARYAGRGVGLYIGILWPGVPYLVGLSFGAAAGRAIALDPATIVLFAVPYLAMVAGGSAKAVASAQNQRLRAVLDIAERARRETSTRELESHVVDDVSQLLDAPVRLGTAPRAGEIGAPFPSTTDLGRWLVAAQRSGPPTWQGRYRPDEVQSLRTIAAVGSAVTESLHLLDHIRHLATHDPLTGLANRRLLDEELERRLAEAQRHHRPIAVLVIDLDHFKRVNEHLGHVLADDVLVSTARRLEATCRPDDVVARWGGEEFVVVATLERADQLQEFAQRVCAALRDRRRAPRGDVAVTASVGAAAWPLNGNTPTDLLRAADDATLAAKRAGRDRVVVSEAAPHGRDAVVDVAHAASA